MSAPPAGVRVRLVDAKEIRELIELISQSTVSKFEMEREGLKIKVVKEAPVAPVAAA